MINSPSLQVTALDVWVDGIKTGTLERKPNDYLFTYAQNALYPISTHMSVRTESYAWPQLHPIFAQNLPDGQFRAQIEAAYGKEHDVSDMGILSLTGGRQIGAISYSLPGQKVANRPVADPEELTSLTHAGTIDGDGAFSRVMSKYLASGISGVQPKFICDLNTRTSLIGDTCIVKAHNPDLTPELSYNEFFCLRAAREAGMPTPNVHMPDGGLYLVVERFDLVVDQTRREQEKRLAFEEIMVLQAKNNRYDGSWEGLIKTVIENAVPIHRMQARIDLFKLFVLNNFVRNGDAHLKNVGMLYDVRSARMVNRKLAPLYDLTTTSIYQANEIPALHHFQPSNRGALPKKDWATLEDILRMATDVCRISATEANKAINEVIHGIIVAATLVNTFAENNPLDIYGPLLGAWQQGLKHSLGNVPVHFPKTVSILVPDAMENVNVGVARAAIGH